MRNHLRRAPPEPSPDAGLAAQRAGTDHNVKKALVGDVLRDRLEVVDEREECGESVRHVNPSERKSARRPVGAWPPCFRVVGKAHGDLGHTSLRALTPMVEERDPQVLHSSAV